MFLFKKCQNLTEIDGSDNDLHDDPVMKMENGKSLDSVAISVSHSWKTLQPGMRLRSSGLVITDD